MRSDRPEPLNLGSEDLITVDGLVDLVCGIAGKRLRMRHELGAPQGVRGRNSDNGNARRVLGWEPSTPLEDGLRETYAWIESCVRPEARLRTVS
jgi:nucleoside-diphosphate-sugar epimerase